MTSLDLDVDELMHVNIIVGAKVVNQSRYVHVQRRYAQFSLRRPPQARATSIKSAAMYTQDVLKLCRVNASACRW